MSAKAKQLLNQLLRPLRIKIVNRSWGPRGFLSALQVVKDRGVVVEQVVDVGAARGEWSEECMAVYPNARYFLVEPLEENERYLEALRQRHPNVDFWQGALGSDNTERSYYCHGDQSSFFASEYASEEAASQRILTIRTLDSLLEEQRLQAPQLIKVDVQGYELEVLRGATRCLQSAELVLLEVSYQQIYEGAPLAHEVISFMGERGFAIYDICSYAQRPLDGALAQSDLLFARQDSQLFAAHGWAR